MLRVAVADHCPLLPVPLEELACQRADDIPSHITFDFTLKGAAEVAHKAAPGYALYISSQGRGHIGDSQVSGPERSHNLSIKFRYRSATL